MSNMFYFTYETGLVEAKSLEELNHQMTVIKQRGGDVFMCSSVADLQHRIFNTNHTVVLMTLSVTDSEAAALRELNENAKDYITDHIKHFGCLPVDMAIITGECDEHDQVVDIDQSATAYYDSIL